MLTTIVLAESDAQWLSAMMGDSLWRGMDSELITRVRRALAEALDAPDDTDGALEHAIIPQENIGAAEFAGE